ncbi:FtsQ-type POTRA domain-containing protein [Agromyces bauzanensis]
MAEADRVDTEPITVVAASAMARRAPATSGAVADPAATDVLERLPAPAVSEQASDDLPSDPRAAKRALAAAARERRRYERQEVRRFTKRSRRRRITWAVAVGSILVLVAVVAGVAYSPLMALREVRIEGAQRIPAADLQATFVDLMGTPLTLIDSGEVHSALSEFPLIETYSTETIPPDTLVVRIVERTPVGVIDTGSGLELVDAAGVVIERPEARPDGQPLIEVEGGVADKGFRAVAGVVRSLPADVRAQLTRASAATADDVRLELVGGASVVWGSSEDSALKATVLAALMRAAPPDTVSLYDVSAPTSPVWR